MATLQALLDDPSLELTVHALGEGRAFPEHAADAGAIVFDAVRSADLDEDRPWLDHGDLRLTEAPYERPRPRPDPLLTPAPAALVYALTPLRREVPAALVRRAEESGVALLALGPTVNLARLEAAALRALVRDAGPAGKAAAAGQRYLLGALQGPKPERELLERLQRLSGESAVLVAPWGAVLARAGSLSWHGTAEQIQRLPEGRMRLGGQDARALRVAAAGRLRSVLLVTGGDDASLPWLELCRTLLAVTAVRRAAEAEGEAAKRGALLAEWLTGPQSAASLAPRLEQAGLDLENPYAVAVAELGPEIGRRRSRGDRRLRLDRLRAAGDDLFASLGLGALSETLAEHCVWAFGTTAPEAHAAALLHALEAAAPSGERPPSGEGTPSRQGAPPRPTGPSRQGTPPRQAARAGEGLRLGVSLPHHDITTIADAYRQARLALQTVVAPPGLAHFDTFDPVYWVLAQQPEENLVAFRDRLIGPVKAADDGKLWRTLVAYLRHPDDLQSLAARLHIHVNTLRYRLKRIEALLREPLQRPETLAKLHLAEQVDAMLEQRAP